MWNAVNLVGPPMRNAKGEIIHVLNLAKLVKSLHEQLKTSVDSDANKLFGLCNKSQHVKMTKAIRKMQIGKNWDSVIYELIKEKGLSKNVFIRSLHYSKVPHKDSQNKYYYVNYKYLDRIIKELYQYARIIYKATTKDVIADLVPIDPVFKGVQDCLTLRTIPMRKVLIDRKYRNFHNGGSETLHTCFIKKICKLKERLDIINNTKKI